jgi:membrane protease YdiL (CAAX protease family)
MEEDSRAEFGWKHLAPGLVYIALIDILGMTGRLQAWGWLEKVWVLPLVILPWGLVMASPERLQRMGYRRQRWLLNLGWGIVTGGLWRLASLVLNLMLTHNGAVLFGWGDILSAAVFIPWIEETYFRGYLGRGLEGHWGFWPSLVVQSILFACHPVHWAQGWPHWISILGFGCLAGWLVAHRQSIWAAWGAHAFANLIPVAFASFV